MKKLEHIRILNEYPPVSKIKINGERMKVAMLVHQNDEWRDYVVNTIENLRTMALMEESQLEVDGKVLTERLISIRGKIQALTDAFNHFENCFATVRREADKEE